MDDLYQDIILDHFKNPRNTGWIDVVEADEQLVTRKAHNASCGDSFEISLRIRDTVVTQVLWKGEGCAISTASMSMVSEWMIGKTVQELATLQKAEILSMFGLESVVTGREKCIYLPLSLIVSV